MNAYERRRRLAPFVYTLCVMLALPPGFLGRAHAAERRNNTLTRDSLLETFRNPQFSSAAANRFLFTHGPSALTGGGGASFANPASAGYGGAGEPETHWLTNDGRIEWSAVDAYLPSVGMPLALVRTYRGSVSSYDGPLGKSWDFNWNVRLRDRGLASNVTVEEQGRSESYPYSGGTYSSPIGRFDSLARDTAPNPDEYVRTDRYGVAERYEYDTDNALITWYRLKSITDLNSNATTFAYDASRNLTKVTDTLSRDTTLAYDTNDRITKVTDAASREWVYSYDGSGYLTTVRTPVVDEEGSEDDYTSGKTTSYKYDGSNRLTEIVRPGDSTGLWKWAFDGSGKVTKHTRGGNDITLAYGSSPHSATVTDREGDVTTYLYDNTSRLITQRNITKSGGTWESSWVYDSNANVLTAIFPKGNRVAYDYDGSGNVLSVKFRKDASDSTPITWAYSYAANARLSTLTDPNGKVWDYDYDSAGNLTRKAAPTVTVPVDIDEMGVDVIVETWAYHAAGLVTRHTDVVGTHHDYEYSTINSKPAYPVRVIADSGGHNLTTSYAYNSAGNVSSVTDPEGNATSYVVNALNQVLRTYEPLGVTRKAHYDLNDRVTKTEATNDTDVGDSLYVVENSYDAVDNLTKTIADVDATSTRLTTTYAYDKNDRLTKVTSPVGNETVYDYDERDLQTSVTRKAASSTDDAITTNAYDAYGRLTKVTDPRGNHTTYALDDYDRVIAVTKPAGNYVERSYDAAGNVITSSSKASGGTLLAQTIYRYDEANRLYQTDRMAKKADLSTNLGDGVQSDVMYRDEAGRVLEHSGDICGCSVYDHVYDALGRQITSKDPMGATDATRNLVIAAYDKNGRVTKNTRKERSQDTGIEADKDIVTEFVYDARNRMITRKETLASGVYGITEYFYGKRDQVTKVVDAMGDETRTAYNEQLWKTSDTAENGSADVVTEYVYDADGRMLTYRAKNSSTGDQETIYAYDKLSRVLTTTWPDAGKHIYTYDKASNRISTTDPNGTVVVAGYDVNNRLTAKTLTLASGVVGATGLAYGYDGLDRLTSADSTEASWSSVVERTYNTLGKIQTEKQILDGYNSGNGRTITYDWDVEGQKTAVTYPVGGAVLSYTRDDLDRVDKISRGGVQVVDYTFSGSRVLKKAYPGSHATSTYDGFGRLTSVHHKDTSSGNTLGQFVYGWDKSHAVTSQDKLYYDDVQNTRITSATVDLGDQYAYDGAGRLVTALRGVPSAKIDTPMATNISNTDYADLVEYPYDPTGNRTTRKIDGADDKVYAYNTVNEMTTEGSATREYNANGAMTGTASLSTVHGYDHADHYARYFSGIVDSPTYVWHYDALGRMVAREKVSGSGGAADVRMYFDGEHDIEVVQWNGSAESHRKTRVYGERIDELLEYTDISADPDDVYYAHTDMLGSVQLMVDDTGAIAESYRYSDWGQTTVVDGTFAKLTTLGSGIGNFIRYTARERALPATFGDDWYFYRARMYRPDAGRFGQRDPAYYGAGENLYTYVRSNPILYRDPTGRIPWVPGVGGVFTPGIPGTTTRTPGGGSIYWTPDPPPIVPFDPCADPCADLSVHYPGHAGFIACCNGKKTVCTNVNALWDPKAKTIIDACLAMHEESHLDDVECVDSGLYIAPWKPGVDKDALECTGHKIAESCLKSGKSKCDGEPDCEEDIDVWIEFTEDQQGVKCH